MKIERSKSTEAKKFKPVTLIITIESKEELYNLYQRLSVCDANISDDLTDRDEQTIFCYGMPFYESEAVNMNLWNTLSSIIDEKQALGEV